jgi:hypothetical protein
MLVRGGWRNRGKRGRRRERGERGERDNNLGMDDSVVNVIDYTDNS